MEYPFYSVVIIPDACVVFDHDISGLVISGLSIFRSGFNKRLVEFAEKGDYVKVQQLHIISGLLKPLLMGLITFLSLQLGSDVMKSFLDQIPPWVHEGLRTSGSMLPALGFALLMNVMFNKKVAPYFFLGFVLSSYLKLPMIAIGALGTITQGRDGGKSC